MGEHKHEHKAPVPRIAIVTCSDTRGMRQDTAGAALEELIAEQGWIVADHVVVKDERDQIADAIVRAADEIDADVVLTCGGSGLSLRDVTPEATADVCERNVPGVAEAMRAHSLAITPFAMLSRAVCMQRGRHLVVINREATPADRRAELVIRGDAAEALGEIQAEREDE